MDIIQSLTTYGTMGFIFLALIWFINVGIFGMIMKHFIREAIIEALEETKLSKKQKQNPNEEYW